MHISITNLEDQIGMTKRKLASSEGDRAALIRELKDLQARKDDLEKKFNDLAALKEQIHTLREELSIARRLDWIRRGIYETFNQKGAERLLHPAGPLPVNTNSSLNVELRQNGGVKIEAPPPTQTRTN